MIGKQSVILSEVSEGERSRRGRPSPRGAAKERISDSIANADGAKQISVRDTGTGFCARAALRLNASYLWDTTLADRAFALGAPTRFADFFAAVGLRALASALVFAPSGVTISKLCHKYHAAAVR